MRAPSAVGSTGTPSSRAYIMRIRSSGRGNLPVWVVRKRLSLRFTVGVPPVRHLTPTPRVNAPGASGPPSAILVPPHPALSQTGERVGSELQLPLWGEGWGEGR